MESLIAIIVGGIACIALVSVAVAVIREAKNNEYRDALTFHSSQGLERVRVLATTDFQPFLTLCTSYSTPFFAWLNTDGSALITNSSPQDSSGMCLETSGADQNDGSDCYGERLKNPAAPELADLFYRNLMFEDVSGGNCTRMRVTVYTGMLGDPDLRNFIEQNMLVGYITQ